MAFVQLTKISLAFGDRDVLRDLNLNLATGSRAALTGINGSGKSTFMQIIAGLRPADSGERTLQKGCRISYLPQSGIVHRGRTVREEIETAYRDTVRSIEERDSIGQALESAKQDDKRTAGLLEEYHRLNDCIEASGYYARDIASAVVLEGLGFAPAESEKPVEQFSGGWQMRIALAKVLLESPDILLLDEPTNYLDIEARRWLESWLKTYSGGYLLVSHDRYFLDSTVQEVYELFQGKLNRYVGNYSAYEKMRQAELDALLKRYAEQQEEIARNEELIRRFRYKASKAAMVQERIKKLEKLERIEIPEALKKISITFPPPPHAGRIALTATGITKQYGHNRILSHLELLLESGEKLVVVGRNGAGKSTLLRILAGVDSAFEGSVHYGTGIVCGYFSQESAELLGGSETILKFMESQAPTALIPQVRDMLGAFLFRADDVYKPVHVLSGGEKSRLALLKMLLKPLNLLILDEPTNHLDLHSKDILLTTLKAYAGTVIFVSHDRSFMEGLSTKTLELCAGHHGLFYGNYAYYLEKTALSVEAPVVQTEPKPQEAKLNRETAKRQQALIRRFRRQEDAIVAQLEALEKEKARLEAELMKPEVYGIHEKARAVQAQLTATGALIERTTAAWEKTLEELADVKSD
ncbi:MAG: ABC-F family ATP-binding cassette domain-containing protein [Spirochaetaceae bacterium]|jgi:ATP-binding cassette subfamily F protein 3|nr:ABC-F family ATP-binding cassette domain-containing protein [Spirochaetaceae bacterium]